MANKTLTLFDDLMKDVRTVECEREDGKKERRWGLNDTIIALGYKNTVKNIEKVSRVHVSKDNKKVVNVKSDPAKTARSHSRARKTQRMNTVTITGVIELITNSKLEKPKELTEHIYGVVIPYLLKNGFYVEGMENFQDDSDEQSEFVHSKIDAWDAVRNRSINAHNEDAKYIIKKWGSYVRYRNKDGKIVGGHTMAILEDEMVNIPLFGKRAKDIKKRKKS